MSADVAQRFAAWHEILERNHGADDLMIIGMQTGGVGLAEIASAVAAIEDRSSPPERSTQRCTGMTGAATGHAGSGNEIPEVAGKTIVLVDDVLFTGRTVRAPLMPSTPMAARPQSNSR